MSGLASWFASSGPDVAIEIAPVVEGAQIVDGRILISRSGTYQISCTSPVASQIKPPDVVTFATVDWLSMEFDQV